LKGTFQWTHPQGFISIPVSVDKSTDYPFKSEIHLVCNECKGQVSQKYECPKCSKTFSRGELRYKKDEINDVVFLAEAEKQFTASKVEPVIRIEKELPLNSVLVNLEFVEKHHEISNNDNKYSPVVKKIHQYLIRNQKALLATFGMSQKERTGLIVPQSGKLLMMELRAGDLIREPKQLNLDKLKNPVYETLVKYSEDLTVQVYDEFIETVKAGKEIKIQPKKEVVKAKVECSFLDA